jgi:hypothetical protein
MKLNLNQPAAQILLDLIWRSNGLWLQQDYMEFGTPVAIGNAASCGPDTLITVTADQIEDNRFEGSQQILYRRLPLDEVLLPAVSLTVAALPFNLVDLLPAINQAYQLQLTAADIVNTQYADLTQPVVLAAAPESLCYSGQVQLTVVTVP